MSRNTDPGLSFRWLKREEEEKKKTCQFDKWNFLSRKGENQLNSARSNLLRVITLKHKCTHTKGENGTILHGKASLRMRTSLGGGAEV